MTSVEKQARQFNSGCRAIMGYAKVCHEAMVISDAQTFELSRDLYEKSK